MLRQHSDRHCHLTTKSFFIQSPCGLRPLYVEFVLPVSAGSLHVIHPAIQKKADN